MSNKHEEWLKQADYDMDTADVMFNNGRYFYAVFMCHLSIEKALKGLYIKTLNHVPPKTHNLLYLLTQITTNLHPKWKSSLLNLIPPALPHVIQMSWQKFKQPILLKLHKT